MTTPVQVLDSELPQETSGPIPEAKHCEKDTQVIPDMKNAHVQATQSTKTSGMLLIGYNT